MSKAGERLLRGAEQALAYAEARAKAGTFRAHNLRSKQIDSRVQPKSPDAAATEKQDNSIQNGNIANERSSD